MSIVGSTSLKWGQVSRKHPRYAGICMLTVLPTSGCSMIDHRALQVEMPMDIPQLNHYSHQSSFSLVSTLLDSMTLLLSFKQHFTYQLLDYLTIQSTILLLLLGISTYQVVHFLQARNRPPLPTSPPGEFLLGHYRLVPEDAAFKKYAEWSKEYNSDVLFFESFGTKWIVLNSLESATELLEKRGSNYADRPRFVMFEE
ncbi:hypothetical protein QC761_0038990 [Podospora bellae-mahoneyi]|uniref:Cytochrome P450 n=1 Tax=Podospora bellae-mahoneyi TaxID=2093777 RepID=A0ABR0FQA7_9PEZI|nr:hypothetical protein QC761_0038990 [Podospora bellae-mahoneyi]